MTELIGEIFSKIFNDNVILATILVSMVPIMELKGGIPFGMSEAFWGVNALGRWKAFWWAYLGCSIVVVILYFSFVPIMKFFKKTKMFKGLAKFIDNRIKKQSSKMEVENVESVQESSSNEEAEIMLKHDDNKKRLYKILGVFIFTAIPLPLTGVWMGTCISVMIGLNFWEMLVAVELGNLIAGIIISTICVMFPQFTHWLIYIFLILVVIVIIVEVVKSKLNKNKTN